jgi:hypothetical protein
MYKVSMEEARWGAVCPDTFLEVAHDSPQVLTFHGIYYISRTHVNYESKRAAPRGSSLQVVRHQASQMLGRRLHLSGVTGLLAGTHSKIQTLRSSLLIV